MAASQVLATQFIRSIKKGTTNIAVHWVTKTDSWERKILADSTKNTFVEVVNANKDILPANTAIVAMKEGEHPSPGDANPHWTAECQDANGGKIETKHLRK